MKTLFTYRNFYVQQSGPHDCGVACLSMILNYAGRFNAAYSVTLRTVVPVNGLSLLDLQKIAGEHQIAGRCVRMDIDTLGELNSPCILHTKDAKRQDHFIVCFGKIERANGPDYLIGDPAVGLSYISQMDMEQIWVSRTALYFDKLIGQNKSIIPHLGFSLLKFRAFKNAMFFSVPLLNAFSVILGIAFSWMLQRGISTSITDSKVSLVVSLLGLLLLITLFKGLINYIRQQLLIKLNADASQEINAMMFNKVLDITGEISGFSEPVIKMMVTDVLKIQNALTAVVSILIGEGALIIAILAGLWYYDPVSGTINTVCLAITGYLAVTRSFSQLFKTSKLRWHNGNVEKALLSELKKPNLGNQKNERIGYLMECHQQAMVYSREFSNKLVRQGFWNECISTLNVITVFSYGLYVLRLSAISYDKLIVIVILSYFLTLLQTKIANVLGVIFEGAYLADRYQRC